MDDLSRELSISKKTLYKFVDSKTDLLEKVFRHQNKIIDELFDKNIAERENAIDVLFGVSLDVIKMLNNVNPVFTYDLQKFYPDLCRLHYEEKRTKTFSRIKDNLLDGIRQGVYRENLEVDAIAMLYVQNIENVMNTEFLFTKEYSAVQLFNYMFESYIRGIANENGIKYFEEKIKEFKTKV